MNQEEIPDVSQKFPTSLYVALVVGAITILLIGMGTGYILSRQASPSALPADSQAVQTDQEKPAQDPSQVSQSSQTDSAWTVISAIDLPKADRLNWTTYTHPRYDYQIDVPNDAEILESTAGTQTSYTVFGDEHEPESRTNEPYPAGLCVIIKYEFGSVTISAPDNIRYVHCSPSGIGIGAEKQEKNITVEGDQREATGFRYQGDDVIGPSEHLSFETADGFYITYALEAQLHYDDMKERLEEIALTFRSP